MQINHDLQLERKRRGVRCPHCGSTNTAKILWGEYEPDALEDEDVKSGKVYLGGCVPEMVESPEDAEELYIGPATRHCNACDKNY